MWRHSQLLVALVGWCWARRRLCVREIRCGGTREAGRPVGGHNLCYWALPGDRRCLQAESKGRISPELRRTHLCCGCPFFCCLLLLISFLCYIRKLNTNFFQVVISSLFLTGPDQTIFTLCYYYSFASGWVIVKEALIVTPSLSSLFLLITDTVSHVHLHSGGF